MSEGQTSSVLRHVQRLAHAGGSAGLVDHELLGRFITSRDEAAFESLVRRHGPMVLGVCRRVLSDQQDVEDAFQATFLVLVRKAGSVKKREQLGPWLYGVARRSAMQVRDAASKRFRERPLVEQPATDTGREQEMNEVGAVLDEEVQRLPAKYRVPVILCYLQGLTFNQAALQLGWPAGTVSGRLARARSLLRNRLTRRGLAISLVGIDALLAGSDGSAATVPTQLLALTLAGASLARTGKLAAAGPLSANVVSLVEGVMRTMLMTKWQKIGVIFLTCFMLSGGAGFITYQKLSAQAPAAPAARQDSNVQAAQDKAEFDLDAIGAPRLKTAQVEELLKIVPENDRMKNLLRDRYEAAAMSLEARGKEFLAGRGTLEILFLQSARCLSAELEICRRKPDRILAMERHFQLLRGIEQVNKARYDAGRIPVQDWKESEYFRIDAEIALERAKTERTPATSE
jgi:RNA polymerase sigma factor (sigma-70 family)